MLGLMKKNKTTLHIPLFWGILMQHDIQQHNAYFQQVLK